MKSENPAIAFILEHAAKKGSEKSQPEMEDDEEGSDPSEEQDEDDNEKSDEMAESALSEFKNHLDSGDVKSALQCLKQVLELIEK